MRGYRSDDRESFESRISKKPSVISRALHRGITPRHRRQTRFVQVTDPTQFRRFVLREVPQQVRPPIAAANNSNRSCAHKAQSAIARAGFPATVVPGETSAVTTAPAPTIA